MKIRWKFLKGTFRPSLSSPAHSAKWLPSPPPDSKEAGSRETESLGLKDVKHSRRWGWSTVRKRLGGSNLWSQLLSPNQSSESAARGKASRRLQHSLSGDTDLNETLLSVLDQSPSPWCSQTNKYILHALGPSECLSASLLNESRQSGTTGHLRKAPNVNHRGKNR